MIVSDLIKRLEKIDKDKMILYEDDKGGWANIEIEETSMTVRIMCEKEPLFSK
jgi:hypothetical protein